ncbi:hypothetical protein PLICRDRAFT_43053 [Plicaturopsis crispa FD-325 SS-3]|nr:hypothetical protein PLICRDRAFT_43053 [Plicaturopsis crispa FD-325 SS-3]
MPAINLDEVSAYSSPDLVDRAQRQIDDTIDNESAPPQLDPFALKTRRNTLSLISRLPPEILSMIFIAMVCAYLPDPTGWIEATNICRHWRDVALDCPMLWTRIIPGTPLWTGVLLRRSRNAPLTIESTYDVYSSFNRDNVRQSTEMALAHIPRVVSLRLTASAEDLTHILVDFATPAPAMRSLALEDDGYGARYPLPDTFCAGLSSALRQLDLKQCVIPCDSPLLNNLTRLKLDCTSSTVSQMLIMLQRAPFLETLELRELEERDCAPTANAVELTRLNSITISTRTRECVALLVLLAFPPTATVSLRCVVKGPLDTDLSLIQPTLRAVSGAGEGVRSLDISYNRQVYRPGSLSWKDSRTSSPETSTVPRVSVDLDGFGRSAVWLPETIIQDVNKHLSLAQLEYLAVTSRRAHLALDWVEAFGTCVNLRHVSLTMQTVHTRALIAALTLPHASATSAPDVFLPSLECLELRGTRVDFTDELCDCIVSRRAAHGAPLRKIIIYKCRHVNKPLVDRLADLVEVDWDDHADMEQRSSYVDNYDSSDDEVYTDSDSDFSELY